MTKGFLLDRIASELSLAAQVSVVCSDSATSTLPASMLHCGRFDLMYIMRLALHRPRKGASMNLHLSIGPLVSLLAGILILIMPRLLNYIVALYLILIGIIGLVGADKLRL